MTLRPTPVQRPRVPIWVVAVPSSDRSMRRAARWDGIVTQAERPDGLAEVTTWLDRERPTWRTDGYAVVAQGSTPPDRDRAAAVVAAWAEAGATWWLDADWTGATAASLRERILVGPPRLSGGSSAG